MKRVFTSLFILAAAGARAEDSSKLLKCETLVKGRDGKSGWMGEVLDIHGELNEAQKSQKSGNESLGNGATAMAAVATMPPGEPKLVKLGEVKGDYSDAGKSFGDCRVTAAQALEAKETSCSALKTKMDQDLMLLVRQNAAAQQFADDAKAQANKCVATKDAKCDTPVDAAKKAVATQVEAQRELDQCEGERDKINSQEIGRTAPGLGKPLNALLKDCSRLEGQAATKLAEANQGTATTTATTQELPSKRRESAESAEKGQQAQEKGGGGQEQGGGGGGQPQGGGGAQPQQPQDQGKPSDLASQGGDKRNQCQPGDTSPQCPAGAAQKAQDAQAKAQQTQKDLNDKLLQAAQNAAAKKQGAQDLNTSKIVDPCADPTSDQCQQYQAEAAKHLAALKADAENPAAALKPDPNATAGGVGRSPAGGGK